MFKRRLNRVSKTTLSRIRKIGKKYDLDQVRRGLKTPHFPNQENRTKCELDKVGVNQTFYTFLEETMSVSSLERIKSRKPLPLPMDDPAMYEGKPTVV